MEQHLEFSMKKALHLQDRDIIEWKGREVTITDVQHHKQTHLVSFTYRLNDQSRFVIISDDDELKWYAQDVDDELKEEEQEEADFTSERLDTES